MEPDYIKQKALIRILDDDEALGAALKLYLELDGWQVAAYPSARRFFAEDRPSVPGCLVLDVRMPELTGLECQRLLNERQSNIPIVFISGHGVPRPQQVPPVQALPRRERSRFLPRQALPHRFSSRWSPR